MRITSLLIVTCLAGCAAPPTYLAPTEGEPTALVTFEHRTDMIAGSLVRFSHMKYSISSCAEMERFTKDDNAFIGTVDIGNPLVKSVNFENVAIRAEEPLNLRATMSPHGGYGEGVCWVYLSFVPNDKSSYLATANYARNKGCAVVVTELRDNGSKALVKTEDNLACGRHESLEWVASDQ